MDNSALDCGTNNNNKKMTDGNSNKEKEKDEEEENKKKRKERKKRRKQQRKERKKSEAKKRRKLLPQVELEEKEEEEEEARTQGEDEEAASSSTIQKKKRKKVDEEVGKEKDHTDTTTNSVKIKPPSTTTTSSSKPIKKDTERHPFQVDEADHCETPWRAYQDILPVLDKIAKGCGKTRKNLIIYDPYYCDGGIKHKLQGLGFHNVINENRDFYKDIQNQTIPPHDVLLTNPPYSGNHMESLLQFVSSNNDNNSNNHKNKNKNKNKNSTENLIPFLLLLPHYVYTKPYFLQYFQSDARGGVGNNNKDTHTKRRRRQLFYLVPPNRYAYEPPSWVDVCNGSTALARGKTQTAPFPSFWYCHVPPPSQMTTSQIADSAEDDGDDYDDGDDGWLIKTFGPSGMPPNQKNGREHRRLRYANCTAHIPREFKGEFDLTNKRPNPRARKRAAAAKKKKQQEEQQTTIFSSSMQTPPTATTTTSSKRNRRRKKKRY